MPQPSEIEIPQWTGEPFPQATSAAPTSSPSPAGATGGGVNWVDRNLLGRARERARDYDAV